MPVVAVTMLVAAAAVVVEVLVTEVDVVVVVVAVVELVRVAFSDAVLEKLALVQLAAHAGAWDEFV